MEEKKKKKIKGLKIWLKENGYTAEQMQAFWDELIDSNAKVRALHNSGVNWDETNMSIISQLPTEKERTLARKAEAEQKAKEEREAKEKAEAEKKYYHEHFEEIMLDKIDKGESLTESELRTLVFEFGIETEVGDKLRWVQSMFTVVKLCDRTFGINWLEALTEYQENEFIEQPYEVRLQEK